MRDLREIGPTHLLLAPRVWEQTAAEIRARIMDAGRRRGPVRLGGPRRHRRPWSEGVGIGSRTCCCSRPCATGWASPAQVGSHRRGRARPRDLQVLPRHGRAAASSSMARPRPPAPTRCRSTRRSTATARACRSTTPRCASPTRTKVASARSSPAMPACSRATSATMRRPARCPRRRRLAAHRRRRLPRRQGSADGHRPGQGHRPDRERCQVQPAVHREQAQVLALCRRVRRARPGRPFLAAIVCIRYSMVAKWAEAQPDRLHQLPEPRGPSARRRAARPTRSRRSMPCCPSRSESAASSRSTRSSTPTTAS